MCNIHIQNVHDDELRDIKISQTFPEPSDFLGI